VAVIQLNSETGKKDSWGTIVAKIVVFTLPFAIFPAALRNHPDIGSVIGINVGAALCFYLVPPRRLSFLKSLLLGITLSAIYLFIMHFRV
jgi:hypothetical protein